MTWEININAAECAKCGDYIESKHRHDMVWCKCGAIAVDGGQEYFHRAGKAEDIIERSISIDTKNKEVRKLAQWR